MSTTTLVLSEDVLQRLHQLSARAGEPAEAVLDHALADYESKLLAAGYDSIEPRADSEVESAGRPRPNSLAPPRCAGRDRSRGLLWAADAADELRGLVNRERTTGLPMVSRYPRQ